MHQSTIVPTCQSTIVPMHQSTIVPTRQSTIVPTHQGTIVPMHQGTIVSCPVPDSPPAAAQAEPAAVRRDLPMCQSTHALTIPHSIAVPMHQGTIVSCPVPDSPSVAAQAEPAAVRRDVRAERRLVLPQHAERGAPVPQPARLRDLLLGHLRLERLHPATHRARLWGRSASQE